MTYDEKDKWAKMTNGEIGDFFHLVSHFIDCQDCKYKILQESAGYYSLGDAEGQHGDPRPTLQNNKDALWSLCLANAIGVESYYEKHDKLGTRKQLTRHEINRLQERIKQQEAQEQNN